MTAATQHPREIELKRLLAGETIEEAAAHVGSCGACKARVKELEDQQQRFEAAIPFERFAAGVERATRQPRVTPKATRGPVRILMAIAATVLLLAGIPLAMRSQGAEIGTNRLKGGSEVEVVVAGPANGPQRMGSHDPLLPEALGPGERVRIGFRAGGYRYLAAVSIDEKGEVTALYPERGPSLRVRTDGAKEYLSDSLEFTGHGLERVVVVMTAEPLDVEDVRRAAKARYDEARGNLTQLGTLDLPGEQFHRTFLKP
jgi:hypothetical protein